MDAIEEKNRKTLVVYASKHGAAREAARRIAAKIEGAVTHDLAQGGLPALAGFDRVILGSSVYAGRIRKEAKDFLTQNTDVLYGKQLGLFLCGMDTNCAQNYFDANFSLDILQAAKAASFVGGIYDPKKAGFFERFIYKVAAKQSDYADTLDDGKIHQFAEAMNA